MSKPFRTTIEGGIAELAIDHPPVNALDSAGWHALAGEVETLGRNPEVKVIVIRAEGRGFCAGVDIKELAAHPNLIVSVNAGCYDLCRAIHRNPIPVIAAVHGFVLGGGIGICGAADGTGQSARFDVPSWTAVDSAGNVYVSDYLNFTVRQVTPGMAGCHRRQLRHRKQPTSGRAERGGPVQFLVGQRPQECFGPLAVVAQQRHRVGHAHRAGLGRGAAEKTARDPGRNDGCAGHDAER